VYRFRYQRRLIEELRLRRLWGAVDSSFAQKNRDVCRGFFVLGECYFAARGSRLAARGSRLAARGSVPEVAHTGKHHRDFRFVGGGDHFIVAHRAARLDDGSDAGRGGVVQSIAEGEEGV